jgi:GGDEF domain-containing protein
MGIWFRARCRRADGVWIALVAGVVAEASSPDVSLGPRFGGEEFTVILPSTPLAGACAVADRIRAQSREAADRALYRAARPRAHDAFIALRSATP